MGVRSQIQIRCQMSDNNLPQIYSRISQIRSQLLGLLWFLSACFRVYLWLILCPCLGAGHLPSNSRRPPAIYFHFERLGRYPLPVLTSLPDMTLDFGHWTLDLASSFNHPSRHQRVTFADCAQLQLAASANGGSGRRSSDPKHFPETVRGKDKLPE